MHSDITYKAHAHARFTYSPVDSYVTLTS